MVRVGVSGSTVLSESARLDELFWDGIDHIEVGALSSARDLDYLLARAKEQAISVGFHSPLFAGGSKYDLLKHIQHPLQRRVGNLRKSCPLLSQIT